MTEQHFAEIPPAFEDQPGSDQHVPSATESGPAETGSTLGNWIGALQCACRSIPMSVWLVVAALIVVACSISFAVVNTFQKTSNAADARIAAGEKAMMDGDLDKALFEYTAALQINPRAPGAHKALGQIALANGRADEAVRHLEAELKVRPSDRFSHLALGCLYSLGLLGENDPHRMRTYLLDKFSFIAPAKWADSLVFSPSPEVDPLTTAIFHFQFARESAPNDPNAAIGVALAHLANYNLANARDKLSRLYLEISENESIDESELLLVNGILHDINQEEQFIQTQMVEVTSTEMGPGLALPETPTETPGLSAAQPEINNGISTLPPIPTSGEGLSAGLPPINTDLGDTTFGHRYPAGPVTPETGTNLGLQLSQEDLQPKPTVKPISRDVNLDQTHELVHTVRLANIFEPGDVGFQVGETVVMPNTNVDVKVVEYSDDRIVLEEHGSRFIWVPGDVGWVLQDQMRLSPTGEPLPEPELAPAPDEQASDDTGEIVGPEVPSGN